MEKLIGLPVPKGDLFLDGTQVPLGSVLIGRTLVRSVNGRIYVGIRGTKIVVMVPVGFDYHEFGYTNVSIENGVIKSIGSVPTINELYSKLRL